MSRRTLRSVNELRVPVPRSSRPAATTPRVARPGEPELAELADDVNHLAATLAETEQRRAALIGDVAHEMRTPLTTISGTLEGFDDGLFTQAELTDTVRTEVDRLGRLAGDLAAASGADEGQLHLDRQPGDLAEVVDRRGRAGSDRSSIRPRSGLAGRVDRDLLPADFDRERMVQVLTNLLGNALAYTPARRPVDVHGANAHGRLRHLGDRHGPRVCAPTSSSTSSNGSTGPIAHDHSGGTGIGLTISRAIAQAHGGELIARSAGEGRGSTFEISAADPVLSSRRDRGSTRRAAA